MGLLKELNDCKEKIEDNEEVISLLRGEVTDLKEKLISSEGEISEMVPISKVKEMEAMFMDTVNKLSNRVNSLEHAMQTSSSSHLNYKPVVNPSGWKDRIKASSSCENSLPPIPNPL